MVECQLTDLPRAAGRAPLVLLTGHRHFNEVFFGDAVVKENLLGPFNQGWTVSTTMLMYERHSARAQPDRPGEEPDRGGRRPRQGGDSAWDDPLVR